MSKSPIGLMVASLALLAMLLAACSSEPVPASTPVLTPTPTPRATSTPVSAPVATTTPVATVIDHGNARAIATEVAVGQGISSVIDYEDDADFFRFFAIGGEVYEIYAATETENNGRLQLWDSEGRRLAHSYGAASGPESVITWEAPESEYYYISVEEGSSWFYTGVPISYMLRISPSDIEDDHGNNRESPTDVAVGGQTEGSLDYDGDVDVFGFNARAGELYEIELDLRTLERSSLTILDSNGWGVAQSRDEVVAPKIVWAAVDSGQYYVEVAGTWETEGIRGRGTYIVSVSVSDIEDDHGNDTESATDVVVGQEIEGNVDYRSDIDVFRFSANRGQAYEIDVELVTLEDSGLKIFDEDREELAYNDDYGNSLASRIAWGSEDSGDYYIEVFGWDITGSYVLSVRLIADDHGSDTESATVIGVGEEVEGNVEFEGDIDLFLLSATRGEAYEIKVALGTLVDSELAIIDKDGEELAYNDDYGDSVASRIAWVAEESGDYYIEVFGWDITGSYVLSVTLIADDHGNDTDSATVIGVGEDVQGNLDYEGDIDVFGLSATRGGIYEIDVALGTLEDSELVIINSEGVELAYNDDYGDSWGSRIAWVPEMSGDYYIEVAGWDEMGSYVLSVTVIEDDYGNERSSAKVIVVGDEVEGRLDYEGDIDLFRLSATRGGIYEIGVVLGTLKDSELAIIDKDGEELAYNDDYGDAVASRIAWVPEISGDYYIEVAGWDEMGSYVLSVTAIKDDYGNDTDSATVIVVGDEIEGDLKYEGDIDVFVLSAVRGQRYVIDVDLVTLEDSELAIIDYDGTQLAYNDDFYSSSSRGSRIVWEPERSGDYYIEVSGWDVIGSATYVLSVWLR